MKIKSSEIKLSIVILNHNSGRMLLDCLNSFLSYNFPFNIEVIIPDNASSDNSIELAEKKWCEKIIIIRNKDNKGFSHGNNIGVRASSGEYICLLNPDTIVSAETFITLISFMEKNSRAGIVGPKVLNKDGSFQLSAKRSIPNPFDAISRALLLNKIFPNIKKLSKYNLTYLDENEIQQVDASTGCCMLTRREMIDDIGLLDENFFIYCEDVDWFLRAKKAGWEVWYIPAAVIEHHHAYSESFRKYKAVRNFHNSMIYFYKKHYAADYPFIFNHLIYFFVRIRMVMMMSIKTLRRWK
jgi:GT2 family glycosyltransferase